MMPLMMEEVGFRSSTRPTSLEWTVQFYIDRVISFSVFLMQFFRCFMDVNRTVTCFFVIILTQFEKCLRCRSGKDLC